MTQFTEQWAEEAIARARTRRPHPGGPPSASTPAGHIYQIDPVAKPRQTQRDKWMRRPCVMQYRAFADQVRAAGIQIPDADVHILFVLPMPESWSPKKKDARDGTPHQAKPDLDNLLKALVDACRVGDDQRIWRYGSIRKIWGRIGRIEIE